MRTKKITTPENKIGRDWVVNSMAKVKNALEWLGFIKSEHDRINALIASEVQVIHEKYASQLEISGRGRKRVTFYELAALLTKEIVEFCGAHRVEILKSLGNKKTREFDGAGTLSFKDQPARIDNVDAKLTPAECLKHFTGEIGLSGLLNSWLTKQVVWRDEHGTLHHSHLNRLGVDQQEHQPDEEFGTINLSLLISIAPSFDRTRIKNNLECELLSAEQLKAIGLKLHEPEEKLFIKPAQWNVQSESEQTHAA